MPLSGTFLCICLFFIFFLSENFQNIVKYTIRCDCSFGHVAQSYVKFFSVISAFLALLNVYIAHKIRIDVINSV